MILTCPNCTTRVQLDDAKIPAPTFKIRCPKCDNTFNAQLPQKQQTASPMTDIVTDMTSIVSTPTDSMTNNAPTLDAQNLLRMFAALLQQSAVTSSAKNEDESKQCRVMLCATPASREAMVRALKVEHDNMCYQISVAADTAQAVEALREERYDVIILDSEFEEAQKGAAFIKREIHTLRPAQRRRLFLVSLSNGARTADAHEAFIYHLNLTVNYNDILKLPQVLERARRDFDDLYRDFNAAQKAMTF